MIDLNKFTSSKPRGRKKGSKKGKSEAPKKPIKQVVSERAAAQIIARAQKIADDLDAKGGDAIMKQLEYQAECNLRGNYKYIFTGPSHLRIYPDGSKEAEIPQAVRGKVFKKYRAIMLDQDIFDEE